MALLQRADVRAPVLPKETVPVPALGGDVVVRGLLLSQRLALHAYNARQSQPQPGETDADARARAGAQLVAHTLAQCVCAADDQPLYTTAEWEAFGSAHPAAALDLFYLARRLNGMDDEATEKN
jgi:hypothetical protein